MFSDQPDVAEFWDVPRFVDEVEQVRLALHLERENFYLLGHSWGGILALEYALAHQDRLKALVIFEHDVQHPRLQQVRGRRDHAGHG